MAWARPRKHPRADHRRFVARSRLARPYRVGAFLVALAQGPAATFQQAWQVDPISLESRLIDPRPVSFRAAAKDILYLEYQTFNSELLRATAPPCQRSGDPAAARRIGLDDDDYSSPTPSADPSRFGRLDGTPAGTGWFRPGSSGRAGLISGLLPAGQITASGNQVFYLYEPEEGIGPQLWVYDRSSGERSFLFTPSSKASSRWQRPAAGSSRADRQPDPAAKCGSATAPSPASHFFDLPDLYQLKLSAVAGNRLHLGSSLP